MTATAPVESASSPAAKKKLARRRGRDHSQALRRAVQLAFLSLNLWIGFEFVRFVRFCESGGHTAWAGRPAGVEGWLPIASMMNLRLWLGTGHVPATHPAGMFLLLAFLAISFVMRKAFCSWLCPVGTVSEYLWKVGRQTFKRNLAPPRWLDAALQSLKYILLSLFVYAVCAMSLPALRAFLEGPYGVIADVKMLNFFRFLSVTSAVVLGVLALASIFVQNFWCRYLCPYGALLGLAAKFSPARIRREPGPCIDCAKCAQACPSLLKVDKLVTITSAECTACLECVAVCPAEGALLLTWPRRRRVPAWAVAAAITVLFIGIAGYARWAGHWHTDVPSQVYFDLIPRANEFAHP
jgi:polyferredoxin